VLHEDACYLPSGYITTEHMCCSSQVSCNTRVHTKSWLACAHRHVAARPAPPFSPVPRRATRHSTYQHAKTRIGGRWTDSSSGIRSVVRCVLALFSLSCRRRSQKKTNNNNPFLSRPTKEKKSQKPQPQPQPLSTASPSAVYASVSAMYYNPLPRPTIPSPIPRSPFWPPLSSVRLSSS